MTKEELKELVKKHPSHFSFVLKKNHRELYDKINNMFDYTTFSQKLYDYIYEPDSSCTVCGKQTKYYKMSNGYSDTCSYKCRGELNHQIAVEIRKCVICGNKFEIYKKRKKTTCSNDCLLELNRSEDVTKKRQRTLKKWFKENYGVEYFFQSDEFKEMMKIKRKNGEIDYELATERGKKTKLLRYGDKNYNNLAKAKETSLNNYGVDNFAKTAEFKHVHRKRVFDRLPDNIKFVGELSEYNGVNGSKYKFECLDCGNNFTSSLNYGIIPICRVCKPFEWNTSKFEDDIFGYIRDIYSGNIISSDRSVIKPRELDIYIPDKKIAIECNGNYWHSELCGKKDKNYHISKTEDCHKKGIRLIHIFEDEWTYKKDIVKNRLKHILKLTSETIYARNTTIKEIDTKLKSKFLEETHIQGNDKSSVKLGMFYDNELVGVMTFSKRKIFGNDDWELSRFATKYNIIGAASKLFAYFAKHHKPKKVITYSDIRWNSGSVYDKMGFEKVSQTKPGYFYLKNGQRINRINFQKHKLKDKLDRFDEGLTEWENMQNNGYDRIWDCGHYKFEWVV